jgi:uncharacterized protein (TIGR02266 family)
MDNRRRHQRYRVSLAARLNADGPWVTAHADNLSQGGARFSLDAPLLEGSPVKVDLRLAGGGEAIRASGTVIWCNEHMDVGFQAGVSFADFDTATRERLDQFLASCKPI